MKTEVKQATGKRAYEPPQFTCVGLISEVVLGGGGKLSVVADDKGDVRKPSGQG
jgi:hypothetical protein